MGNSPRFRKTMLLVPLLAIALCGCAAGTRPPGRTPAGRRPSSKAEDRFFIGSVAVGYLELEGRWPESLDELKKFWMILRGTPETTRLDRYAEAAFTPLPDGSLKIEYALRGSPGRKEWVTVTAPWPREE